MIRITLVKDAYTGWSGREVPARVEEREFEDHAEATNWLIDDSYFDEAYTRAMTWERIP